MTFDFDERRRASAIAFLHWEKKRIPFKIEVPNINQLYVEQMREDLLSWPGFHYQKAVRPASQPVRPAVFVDDFFANGSSARLLLCGCAVADDAERMNCAGLVFMNVEELVQASGLKQVLHFSVEIYHLKLATLLFESSMRLHQLAESGAVDVLHAAQVQKDSIVSL